MATNLMTELMDVFHGDTLNGIASTIGEDPARTQAALGGVLPALVGGLVNKASTPERAGGLLDLIRRHGLDSDTFGDPARALTAPGGLNTLLNVGGPLIASLFGMRAAAVSDRATSLSGVSSSATTSLMKLLLPLVLGMIAKRVKAAGWNAASLMKVLGEQRSFLRDTPGGLAGIFDENEPREMMDEDLPHAPLAAAAAPQNRSAWRWALPLLLLIPLIGYFLSRSDEPRREATVRTPAPQVVPQPLPRSLPEPTTPVGTTGMATRLPADHPLRITFGTNSGDPTAESSAQLREIAVMLKSRPQAKLEITGYTDSVGDDAHNLTLSETRAAQTRDHIAGLGVDRSRMTTKGLGEANPVGDNTTAEGRHQNRRVEIRITDR